MVAVRQINETGSKFWETLHSSPGQHSFLFYFIIIVIFIFFLLYNIVLVLPYINIHSYRQCELQFFKDYMQQTGDQVHLFF